MKRVKELIFFNSGENGLTLIEVVISLAIFAIGFLAVAGLVVTTTRNNTTGNMLTVATMAARTKLEYLKSLPLDQLESACPADMEPEKINNIYGRICEISNFPATSTIKTIKVTVAWNKSGQQRQVLLQTNSRGLGK
jgi:prepilin-type N-terminal cleavage/methylation domain-containing protein